MLSCELHRLETSDGLRLDGLLFPASVNPAALPITAALLMHGTGGSFTAGGVLERFAEQAVAAGVSVLRLNSRGHDLVCSLPSKNGPAWGGAAYEKIEDAWRDVEAGVDFLASRGHSRVLLAGHSMGAVKCLLAMARFGAATRLPQVAGVAAISPPRFCHENLLSGPGAEAFLEAYELATYHTAVGQAQTLIEVTQPLPLLITAGGFLKKYGPDDEFDFTKVLHRVPCPALVLVGTKSMETSAAFHGLPEALAALQVPSVTAQTVEGANISYAGCADVPFERTRTWLGTL